MRIKRTNKPQGLAYPLDRVKNHLRVDSSDDDQLVSAYINAATDFIGSYTWHYLQSADYTLYLDEFETVQIPMHPVTEITSVKYYDENGTLQTMVEDTDYWVSLNGNLARVEFENTYTLRDKPYDSIEIAFKAGYASWFEIPDDLVAGLMIAVADMYDMRQSFSQGASYTESNLTMGLKAILDNNSLRDFR